MIKPAASLFFSNYFPVLSRNKLITYTPKWDSVGISEYFFDCKDYDWLGISCVLLWDYMNMLYDFNDFDISFNSVYCTSLKQYFDI